MVNLWLGASIPCGYSKSGLILTILIAAIDFDGKYVLGNEHFLSVRKRDERAAREGLSRAMQFMDSKFENSNVRRITFLTLDENDRKEKQQQQDFPSPGSLPRIISKTYKLNAVQQFSHRKRRTSKDDL